MQSDIILAKEKSQSESRKNAKLFDDNAALQGEVAQLREKLKEASSVKPSDDAQSVETLQKQLDEASQKISELEDSGKKHKKLASQASEKELQVREQLKQITKERDSATVLVKRQEEEIHKLSTTKPSEIGEPEETKKAREKQIAKLKQELADRRTEVEERNQRIATLTAASKQHQGSWLHLLGCSHAVTGHESLSVYWQAVVVVVLAVLLVILRDLLFH